MHFYIAFVPAFAVSAFAQAADFDPINTPKANEVVIAGAPFTITWDAPTRYLDGTVTIELIGGATQTSQTKLATIATGVKNSANTYSWRVDDSLGSQKFYGLIIRYESNPTTIFQYSSPFSIKASENKPTGNSTVTMMESDGVKTVALSPVRTPVTTTSASVTKDNSSTKDYHNTTIFCHSTILAVETSIRDSALVNLTSTTDIKLTTIAPTDVPTPTGPASAVRVGYLTILAVVAAVFAI